MKKPTQKANTLSILIFESISVSDTVTKIDVIIVEICYLNFNAKEIAKIREVLRISIGSHVDTFTIEELKEFGASLLQATAVVLKAKYLRTKAPLKEQ
jgi:hypothetical protein